MNDSDFKIIIIKCFNGEAIVAKQLLSQKDLFEGKLRIKSPAQIYLNHQTNNATLKEWIPGADISESIDIYTDKILAIAIPSETMTFLYIKEFLKENIETNFKQNIRIIK